MTRKLNAFLLLAALSVSVIGCGEEETPNRDFIPELRSRLNSLQAAILDRNRAAIDSMLSVKILDHKQDSDSLLSFVYGPDGQFDFRRFGDYDIVYTDNRARIDCYLVDSTGGFDRPIALTLIREQDQWLFTRFKPREEEDFTPPDTAGE